MITTMNEMTIASEARAIAEELASSIGDESTDGKIRSRNWPAPLRKRFVELRTRFVERGLNDPVLSRFDSHTVAQPSTEEIANQLLAIAGQLGSGHPSEAN